MASMERGKARRAGTALLWVITVMDATLMGLAGQAKFGATAGWWASMFVTWGYPAWSSPMTGAGELGLAVLMLFPRLASYAASGLIVIMLGALGTVLTHPGRMGPGPPLMHLAVLSIILAARWGVRWKPSAGIAVQEPAD